MAELVVNIIAEQVQEEHIADDMHKAGVQKGVADKLPKKQMPRSGIEHELIGPVPNIFRIASERFNMGKKAQQENSHIDSYEGVIRIWSSSRLNACPDR